jgi:hypothetical protein
VIIAIDGAADPHLLLEDIMRLHRPRRLPAARHRG